VSELQNQSKPYSSSRPVHMPGHSHRHNKSYEESKPLRPSLSREDSAVTPRQKERAPTSVGTALGNASSISLSQRPTSPAPSWGQPTASTMANDGTSSPTAPHGKRSLLNLSRFRRHKEKDGAQSRLKDLPGSLRPSTRHDQGQPDRGQ
jgi:adenylate cyclase